MITPVILIVLYATFLAKVFRDSFTAAIPNMITISDNLINGTVAAQLTASLMAVSCITVTFCVNLTMVQDRANGTRKDFNVSPVSRGKIYLGYFLSTVANSLMVNGLAFVLCLGYLLKMGWYMNIADVLARASIAISAGDDNTKASAELWLKRLRDGNLGILGDNSFLESLNMHEFKEVGRNPKNKRRKENGYGLRLGPDKQKYRG